MIKTLSEVLDDVVTLPDGSIEFIVVQSRKTYSVEVNSYVSMPENGVKKYTVKHDGITLLTSRIFDAVLAKKNYRCVAQKDEFVPLLFAISKGMVEQYITKTQLETYFKGEVTISVLPFEGYSINCNNLTLLVREIRGFSELDEALILSTTHKKTIKIS